MFWMFNIWLFVVFKFVLFGSVYVKNMVYFVCGKKFIDCINFGIVFEGVLDNLVLFVYDFIRK